MSVIRALRAEFFDFSNPPPFYKKIMFIVSALYVDFVWTALMTMFLTVFLGLPMRQIQNAIAANITVSVAHAVSEENLKLTIFLACILAPLWEESIFRYAAIRLGRAWQALWPMILISSVVFGILHGNVLNLLFQGFGGLMYCWLFLRNGNSYWSVVIAHSLWNIFAIFVLRVI